MATWNSNVELTPFIASADLSAKQFTFVALDAAGKVASPSAGAFVDGVIFNNPKTGEPASVAIEHGQKLKVKCGGNIAAGAEIASDANGAAITATTSGHIKVGKALEAGVAGRVIEIVFAYRGAVA